MIIICKVASKIKQIKDTSEKCQTQSGEITINEEVKVNFFLQEFSASKIVMWECHVDKTTES